MSDFAVSVYQRLPSPARNAVSSLRGLYLRRWRYGPETEDLVGAAIERDVWSAERWTRFREERLAAILHRAATRVPYYRQLWSDRRQRGDRRSWEQLENWPLLSKEALRSDPRAFLADDRAPAQMYREQTSGTTGMPIQVWWSRRTVREWFSIYEARIRRWNGVDRGETWAILGGQPVVAAGAARPPFWVWNAPMRQLYFSANNLSPATAGSYLDELERSGATHLVGYPSSLAFLAREALSRPRGRGRPGSLRVVITNAEPLTPWQRQAIREGLCDQVRETYGMAEIAAAGSECVQGALHEWPEVGWIETLDDREDRPAADGETGRLVCTGLLNSDMPLIRYALGDRGRLETRAEPCGCGRRLPVFSALEGRSNDMLVAPDGRRVFWLNPVFYGTAIREAQIVQAEADALTVRLVPAPGFDARTKTAIEGRLIARMGNVRVKFEEHSAIPRGENGKFRPIVCDLPAAGRSAAGGAIA